MQFDSRQLFVSKPLEGTPKVGDFIATAGWSRPRLVVAVDGDAGGSVVSLHEPDTSRADSNGIRRMTSEQFAARSWVIYPELTQLWATAHGE